MIARAYGPGPTAPPTISIRTQGASPPIGCVQWLAGLPPDLRDLDVVFGWRRYRPALERSANVAATATASWIAASTTAPTIHQEP